MASLLRPFIPSLAASPAPPSTSTDQDLKAIKTVPPRPQHSSPHYHQPALPPPPQTEVPAPASSPPPAFAPSYVAPHPAPAPEVVNLVESFGPLLGATEQLPHISYGQPTDEPEFEKEYVVFGRAAEFIDY